MIARCTLPLSLTETEGFNRFLKEVAPLYKAPGRNAITKLMDAKYILVSSSLMNSFKNVEFFCLTSDIWTDSFTSKSYLSLTSHYLDKKKYEFTKCIIRNGKTKLSSYCTIYW